MTVAMFILTALLVGAQVALLERWGTRQSERLEPHPLHSPGGDTIPHGSPR
jgi:hypothetical protein